MIIITSDKDGFRRCGVAHSSARTEWPDDHFTDDELARLQAEPMLSVEVISDEEITKTSGKKR